MPEDPLEQLTHGLFSTTSISSHTQAVMADHPLHPRAAIRLAIVERLRAEMLAPERVLDSPPDPIGDEDVPVLCVYTIEEPAEILDIAWRRLMRELQVAVHLITARRPEQPDDVLGLELDMFAHLIETIVTADRYLGGLVHDLVLLRTDPLEIEPGERTLAHLRLRFLVKYQTDVREIIEPDANEVGVEWDLATPDGEIEARDEIQLVPPEE